MYLSEAMRLGAMSTGQAFGCLFGENNTTCAIGAVIYALGGRAEDDDGCFINQTAINIKFDVLEPILETNLWGEIVRKNNRDKWTREQIADWIIATGQDVEISKEPVVAGNTQSLVCADA